MKEGIQSILLICCLLFLISCSLQPEGSLSRDLEKESKYLISLTPKEGSSYDISIKDEISVKIKTREKTIKNKNKSDVGLSYSIGKDSSDNKTVHLKYTKINIYSDKEGSITDISSANTGDDESSVEQILNALTKTPLVATLAKDGTIKNIEGYDALTENMMNTLSMADENTRQALKAQLNQLVGEGIIKKNITDLFKIFPDSAIYVGDKWKIETKEEGEIGFNTVQFFTLKNIRGGIATIESTGNIIVDGLPGARQLPGSSSEITGTVKATYKINISTGGIESATIQSKISGNISSLGHTIPVSIDIQRKIKTNAVL